MALRSRLGIAHPVIVKAIERPWRGPRRRRSLCPTIGKKVGVSPRQLERLFHRYLQCSPSHYYIGLRLEMARRLLWLTMLSVM